MAMGPRKRHLIAAKMTKPTKEEWVEAMAKPGPQGGCQATVVGNDNDVAHGTVVMMGSSPSNVSLTPDRFQREKFCRVLSRMKY